MKVPLVDVAMNISKAFSGRPVASAPEAKRGTAAAGRVEPKLDAGVGHR